MRFVFVIILFLSAFVAKGQTPTFTFQCVCDYLTAADSTCDICNTTTQSRFFKGLLIYKNGVAYKWIEQPYTIIQNFDALTFRELIPGAEQIRIELLGTAFDSIAQFRDSVMCPCVFGGVTLIPGPGINIYNDTIASIPQQIDTFDLVSGAADTIRISISRDSVPFHFVILPPDANDNWTIDGDGGDTELISTQTVLFSGAGINTTNYNAAGNTLTITGTEVDGSVTNEAWTIDGDDAETEVISNQTVKFQGAGITTTDYNPTTDVLLITSTEVDGSVSNELQTLANTSTATTHVATLSNSGGSVTLAEGSGITIATTGTTLDGIATIAATDASATNEIQALSASGVGPTSYNIDLSLSGGSVMLSEGAGVNLTRTGNDITIASTVTDTDDQGLTIDGTGPTYDIAIDNGTDVTIAGGGIVTLSESPANTLIVTATEVDGSTSNELQSYGHSGTTSYTNTLSSGGGSFTLQSGTNVTLSHTAGITTISAASGADGNGIYGDGTPGSGDDALPAGGSNVSIPNDNSPLDVIVDASPGNPNPFLAIRVLTDYCADDAITKYFIGKSPSDSLSIENFDCGAILNEVGGTLTLQTDKELYVVGDSINLSTVQTRTVMPYLAGLTTSGWLQKIEGTSTGQILVWDEPNGWWEIGAPPGGGTITGSGTSDRVAYWTGSSSIASDNDFTFDGTDVGIGTTTLTARLNVNENTASASPFIANFYSASTSNGSAFIGIANTNNTGTSNVRLGESALGTYGASITRYGSGHSSRAKELNIGTFEPSAPVTFTMNTIVRMTISTDANVYVANKIYAGAGTAVTGVHSTVHSGGSFAGAFLETVGSPTFDDTKHVVVYTGSTNVSWTLPSASSCTGRYYWLHHANSSGTITLSSSISKGNGGNFSTITAGQWAFIVSTGSGWRGFKISSL